MSKDKRDSFKGVEDEVFLDLFFLVLLAACSKRTDDLDLSAYKY